MLHHIGDQIVKLPIEVRDQVPTTGKIESRLRKLESIVTAACSTPAGDYRLGWLVPFIDNDRAARREIRQLDEYFEGRLKRFRLPIDLRSITPFHRKVLDATAKIPFGRVLSYGEVARDIGQPTASRAVGNALGKNPIPIVIPCHRVIAAGGQLGGYTGGLRIKRALMRIEGIGRQEGLFE